MAGTTNREIHEKRERGFGVRSRCINGRHSLSDPSLYSSGLSLLLCVTFPQKDRAAGLLKANSEALP